MEWAGVITCQKLKGKLRILSEASQLRVEKEGSRATALSSSQTPERWSRASVLALIWSGSCPPLPNIAPGGLRLGLSAE